MKSGIFESWSELLAVVANLFFDGVLIFAAGYFGWLGLRFVAILISGEYR